MTKPHVMSDAALREDGDRWVMDSLEAWIAWKAACELNTAESVVIEGMRRAEA